MRLRLGRGLSLNLEEDTARWGIVTLAEFTPTLRPLRFMAL